MILRNFLKPSPPNHVLLQTVNAAPFLINYSGALFREYPGPWQVMLRQDSGQYACVAERPERYRLGQVSRTPSLKTLALVSQMST